MSSSKFHLLCGKMSAGKSTFAAQLSQLTGALLISEDDLLGKLYPNEIVDVQSYVEYSTRLKSALGPYFIELLRLNVQLILDFPANTKNQRNWLFDLCGRDEGRTILHYLECSDELCLKRMENRKVASPARVHTDTIEIFESITNYFEPPAASEGIPIKIHRQTDGA